MTRLARHSASRRKSRSSGLDRKEPPQRTEIYPGAGDSLLLMSRKLRSFLDAAMDFGLQVFAERFGDDAGCGEFAEVGDGELGEVGEDGGERGSWDGGRAPGGRCRYRTICGAE